MKNIKKNMSLGVFAIVTLGVGVYFISTALKVGCYFRELRLWEDKYT